MIHQTRSIPADGFIIILNLTIDYATPSSYLSRASSWYTYNAWQRASLIRVSPSSLARARREQQLEARAAGDIGVGGQGSGTRSAARFQPNGVARLSESAAYAPAEAAGGFVPKGPRCLLRCLWRLYSRYALLWR